MAIQIFARSVKISRTISKMGIALYQPFKVRSLQQFLLGYDREVCEALLLCLQLGNSLL